FEGDQRTARALRAAEGMRSALGRFNATRIDAPPLRIGIAVHAVEVLVGTIGAAPRREYTIIGDVVNVTDRLEKMNKELDSVVIVSANALGEVPEPVRLGLRGPVTLHLPGREEPIAVHYLPREPAAGAGSPST
ncbi:MAG TPA: adenylate/guanylate cyclase domain-containing protein, partial [Candidatus Bathyarchaeia archaeon]|nr:adenylate/guanylate cyclase domain-containing protein [Candidatus Bathyarchaeia archaeon]